MGKQHGSLVKAGKVKELVKAQKALNEAGKVENTSGKGIGDKKTKEAVPKKKAEK
ncbi:MAG: hypothetical protein Edafosvirus5_29 [Edafosvirus sp.]|uniref:Uncharacterized protein n=1 Tax=Edafosvirus sp. TaxID=2487765 RepID=A0A3G4ZVU0_9VIRU|nr:MAG: hypothetical protein Edafosvirus5_29 [Edafosvirus sp.]